MPRKTKNQRRIQEAKQALKKVGTKSGRTRAARKNRPPRPLGLAVHPWCHALLTENMSSNVELPAFGSSIPYTSREFTARVTPMTGVANEFSFVCNPYLAFTNNLTWGRISNNAEVFQFCPTAMINDTATQVGRWPRFSSYTAVPFSQSFTTDSSTGYGGKVRVKYVNIKITYTGTELNKGGIAYFVHNTNQLPLISASDTTGAAGACFEEVITSNSQLANITHGVTTYHMGDELDLTYFPEDFEFHDVESLLQMPVSSGTGIYQENPLLNKYLPNDPSVTANMDGNPLGWNCGVKVVPAAGSPATTAPYLIDVRIGLDLAINTITSSTPTAIGQTPFPPTKRPLSNPVSEAHIRNTLSYVHQHRQRNISHPKATKSALTTAVSKGLLSVATGAAEAFGEQMMSRLAAAA